MHDAISAEKVGITATAIITDRFVETAETMARVTGMPEYPFVVISHPIANNDDATLRKKAEAVVEQCTGILVQA